jgi:non-heme chloroperoxidase
MLDALKLQDMLSEAIPGKIHGSSLKETQEQLKLVEKEITEYLSLLPPSMAASGPKPDPPPYLYALFSGQESFPTIHAPALVIFAVPHDFGPTDNSPSRTQMEARDLRITGLQVKAYETQVPNAHLVRIPHASHYVFGSNEGDVLREMNAFIAALP